jgi:hypothetical protein
VPAGSADEDLEVPAALGAAQPDATVAMRNGKEIKLSACKLRAGTRYRHQTAGENRQPWQHPEPSRAPRPPEPSRAPLEPPLEPPEHPSPQNPEHPSPLEPPNTLEPP